MNKVKFNFLLLISLISLFSLTISSITKAVDYDESYYADNNIIFYTPNSCSSGNASGGNLTGGDASWDGEITEQAKNQLTNELTPRLTKYKDAYIKAEEATGVPWQFIVGIHFKESTILYDPRCGENGDLPCTMANGGTKKIIDAINGVTHESSTGGMVGKDINEDAIEGAKHIIEMAQHAGVKFETKEDKRDMKKLAVVAMSYNAGERCNAVRRDAIDKSGIDAFPKLRSGKISFEEAFPKIYLSPYVLNNVNSSHANMRWDGCEYQTNGQKIADSNAGVITTIKFLGMEIPSLGGGECGGSTNTSGFVQMWQDKKHEGKSPFTGLPEWVNIPYGGGIIADSGCGLTTTAMIITELTGKLVTPPDLFKKSKELGIKIENQDRGGGSVKSELAKVAEKGYGLKYKSIRVTEQEFNAALKRNSKILAGGCGKPPASAYHIHGLHGITSDGKWLFIQSLSSWFVEENNKTGIDPSIIMPCLSDNAYEIYK